MNSGASVLKNMMFHGVIGVIVCTILMVSPGVQAAPVSTYVYTDTAGMVSTDVHHDGSSVSAAISGAAGYANAYAGLGVLKTDFFIGVDSGHQQIWRSTSSFEDTITVASNTLAYGTPVVIDVMLAYSGSWYATAGAAGGFPLSFGGWNISLSAQSSTNTASVADGFYTGGTTGSISNTKTVPLSTWVGQTFRLTGSLNINGYTTYSGVYNQDFGNSGYAYLSSMNDVNFVSAGGHDYSLVPVPAAVWLFGSGLLGLIGFARRNRNQGGFIPKSS